MADVPEHLFLAVDLGTTTLKVMLLDAVGHVHTCCRREISPSFPAPARAEVNPEEWWKDVASGIREVLSVSGVSHERVAAVGVCALMHVPVLVDARGSPVAPAMLWMDQRCAPQARWLEEHYGTLFERRAGILPRTTLSAPKIRWLYENERGALSKARWLLLPKDYIRLRLTGMAASDSTDAYGTALFDREERSWSRELAEVVGLRFDQMPPLLEATQACGTVTAEAAQRTGLAVGTPVLVGASDVHCTMLGSGLLGGHAVEGAACLYVGTAAWIARFRDGHGEELVREWLGSTATSGAALRWIKDLIAEPLHSSGTRYPDVHDVYQALHQEVETVEPGSAGLVFHPHLSGERGPEFNPKAKGVFFGLTLHHKRRHLVKAVIEGVAFSLRALLDAQRAETVPELLFVGGLTARPLWRKLIAEVTGKPVVYMENPEAGVVGLLLLSSGLGAYKDVEHAARELIRVAGRHEPSEGGQAVYGQLYERYRRLEEYLKPAWELY